MKNNINFSSKTKSRVGFVSIFRKNNYFYIKGNDSKHRGDAWPICLASSPRALRDLIKKIDSFGEFARGEWHLYSQIYGGKHHSFLEYRDDFGNYEVICQEKYIKRFKNELKKFLQ